MLFNPKKLFDDRILGINQNSLKVLLANVSSFNYTVNLIEGYEGSGKTTTVKILSKLLGYNLNIYDLYDSNLFRITKYCKRIEERQKFLDSDIILLKNFDICKYKNYTILKEILTHDCDDFKKTGKLKTAIVTKSLYAHRRKYNFPNSVINKFTSILNFKLNYNIQTLINKKFNDMEHQDNNHDLNFSKKDLEDWKEFKNKIYEIYLRLIKNVLFKNLISEWVDNVVTKIGNVKFVNEFCINPFRITQVVNVILNLITFDLATGNLKSNEDIINNFTLALETSFTPFLKIIPVEYKEIIKNNNYAILENIKYRDVFRGL